MNRALLAILALSISALLSGALWRWGVPSPLQAPASFLRDSERRLNRAQRSDAERRKRGLYLTLLVCASALVLGGVCALLLPAPAVLVLLIWVLPVGETASRANTIRKQLHIGNLPAARQALHGTCWRHHAVLDAAGVARGAVEYLAVQYADRVVAPLFWFWFLGMPGLCLSLAASLLQETLVGAAPNPFGQAAHQLHRLMHYVPSRLAALLWSAASLFLPGNRPSLGETLRTHLPDAAPYPLMLRIAAESLHLALGGSSSAYCTEWLGSGSPHPSHRQLTRACYVFFLSNLLLLVLLGLGL